MSFTIFGGELRPEIDLTIHGQLPVSDDVVEQNINRAVGLGLPTYRELKPSSHRLAVIGGGPSIKDNEDKIRDFPGDIWGINGAWKWCCEIGRPDAVFIACDPHEIVMQWAVGVRRALLETRIDPRVFEMLRGSAVYLFDVGEGPGQIRSGSSTATACPHLACRVGYREVTLFGCESNYYPKKTHAYFSEDRPEQILVECDGQQWLTAPDFYIQALELGRYIREVPEFLKEESGGLLRALVKAGTMQVRWVSEPLADNIIAQMEQLEETKETVNG